MRVTVIRNDGAVLAVRVSLVEAMRVVSDALALDRKATFTFSSGGGR
jgi:hypothetical protein